MTQVINCPCCKGSGILETECTAPKGEIPGCDTCDSRMKCVFHVEVCDLCDGSGDVPQNFLE